MKNENVLIVRHQLKRFRNFAVAVELFISVGNNSRVTFWMCSVFWLKGYKGFWLICFQIAFVMKRKRSC